MAVGSLPVERKPEPAEANEGQAPSDKSAADRAAMNEAYGDETVGANAKPARKRKGRKSAAGKETAVREEAHLAATGVDSAAVASTASTAASNRADRSVVRAEVQSSPGEELLGSDLPEGAVLLPVDKPKKKRRPRRRKRKPAMDTASGGQAGQAAGVAAEARTSEDSPTVGGKATAAAAPASASARQGAAKAQATSQVAAADSVAAAGEPGEAAGPAPKKRKRSRRKKKPTGAVLAGAARLAELQPEPRAKAEPYLKSRPHTTGGRLNIHDPAALRPTRQGIIRMRGRTDKGRGWYQEIDLEMAATLVSEHAAVLINPHTIRRLYSNKDFRRYILTRDHYTCYFCGEYGDTIDHLVPRAKGGHSTPDNCVCACSLCNRHKADKDVDVFLKSRR